MPDRTTNTVQTVEGPVYRPTVINCYPGRLDSVADWWREWRAFIFDSSVSVKGKSGGVENKRVSSLLIPIKRSK